MINFTVGPVMSSESVCKVGGEQVPYFRTQEFSDIMLENEKIILDFVHAPQGSRAVFLTGSGTASMEATIINTLTKEDKALVVNGGSFGQRFADLLKLHEIPHTEINLEHGKALTEAMLAPYDGKDFTAFVINGHETSTGVLYDLDMISHFCKKNHLFFIVDAISMFLADPFDMTALGADVMITGSQKALACAPGISLIVLSPDALKHVKNSKTTVMYFDLKDALKNGERGQTPFTPAVGILRQIHTRLLELRDAGGAAAENKRMQELAEYFRERIKDLPFEIVSESLSNAVTPLHATTASAYDIFLTLKDEYGIWVCPNGGDMKDQIFRVGHIGALTKKDYDTLINAFKDMQQRGLI